MYEFNLPRALFICSYWSIDLSVYFSNVRVYGGGGTCITPNVTSTPSRRVKYNVFRDLFVHSELYSVVSVLSYFGSLRDIISVVASNLSLNHRYSEHPERRLKSDVGTYCCNDDRIEYITNGDRIRLGYRFASLDIIGHNEN